MSLAQPQLELEDALAEVLADICVTAGRQTAPNWAQGLMGNPAILAAAWKLAKATLYSGKAPRILKELLVFATAIEERSDYCAELHAYSLLKLGAAMSFDELLNLVKGDSHGRLPDSYRAAMNALLCRGEHGCRFRQPEMDKLSVAGYGHPLALELIATVAMARMFSALTANIEIDPEYRVSGFYKPW